MHNVELSTLRVPMRTKRFLPSVLCTVAAAMAAAPQADRIAVTKADMAGQIDHMRDQAQIMVDTIFSFAEPGVAYHDPLIQGAPGHGEGHNSGEVLNFLAALAVKRTMERDHIKGTIKIWPGIAEEQLGAKAYYVRAGVFKDVDIVLFAHVGNNLAVNWGASGSGLISVEYTFQGESAHAAGGPWRG